MAGRIKKISHKYQVKVFSDPPIISVPLNHQKANKIANRFKNSGYKIEIIQIYFMKKDA